MFSKIKFIYLKYNILKISFMEIISKNEISKYRSIHRNENFTNNKMLVEIKIVLQFERYQEVISPFSTLKMVASWPNW